jgi:hypothetical protein
VSIELASWYIRDTRCRRRGSDAVADFSGLLYTQARWGKGKRHAYVDLFHVDSARIVIVGSGPGQHHTF